MTAIRTSNPFLSPSKGAPACWLLDILRVVPATEEQMHRGYSMIEQRVTDDDFATCLGTFGYQ